MNTGWEIIPVLERNKCRQVSESIKNSIDNTIFRVSR